MKRRFDDDTLSIQFTYKLHSSPGSVALGDGREVVLDGVLAEQPEVRIVHRHDANLQLPRLQILPEHGLQARDGGRTVSCSVKVLPASFPLTFFSRKLIASCSLAPALVAL